MSKKLTAAIEQQGISVPSTLPKHSALVNKIQLLLENEAIAPLETASDHFGRADELFKAIHDTARMVIDDRSQQVNARLMLLRIASLAKTGSYQTADIENLTDVCRESLRDQHMPIILAAVGGES